MIARTLATLLIAAAAALANQGASAYAAEPPAAGRPVQFGDLANPRDAGIRYGQAAGMAVVCLNMKPTAKAEALASSFTGADLETFKVQAETVVQSWKKTLTCAHTSDPNPCRLAHQMSCREAYKEIGPGGLVAPGLVELTTAP
jgi:hypothetical protein